LPFPGSARFQRKYLSWLDTHAYSAQIIFVWRKAQLNRPSCPNLELVNCPCSITTRRTYCRCQPMISLICQCNSVYDENKTRDVSIVQEAEKPHDGEGGEDYGRRRWHEDGRWRSDTLMIGQQPRQEDRKREQRQDSCKPEHRERAFKQKYAFENIAHEISAIMLSTPSR
jgi:hypothetical protein